MLNQKLDFSFCWSKIYNIIKSDVIFLLQKKGDFRKRMHAQASATLEEQFWEDNACA